MKENSKVKENKAKDSKAVDSKVKEGKVESKKHIGRKIAVAVIALIVIISVIYVLTPYRAGKTVAMYYDPAMVSAVATHEEGDQNVTVTENEDGLIIIEPEEAFAGMIFYPGGRVRYDAYIPLMYEFAQRGITCVIVKMPLNFAVLDKYAADGIQEQFPEIDEWYIGGHSLGGAMAASYVKKHTDEYKGLLLLGAYSIDNLTDTGLKVFLAYGTQDGIINRKSYAKNFKNIPDGYQELIIVGGCHSFFGDYGMQSGDGHPYISRADQINYTVDAFMEYIREDESATAY